MKILLLSCSTGEGHNHCALAVKEALQRLGHQAEFLDMLNMFGDPGPLSFDKVLNRISTKAPDIFGMMYHAGQMYSASIWPISATRSSFATSSVSVNTTQCSARTFSRWRR